MPDQFHSYAKLVDRYVARRIKARREVIGMTLQHLSVRCGVTYQQLAKYENGMNRVAAGRLWELSQALGVPVQWFFEGFEP